MTYVSEHATATTDVPLWQPHYGIGFGGAFKRFFQKYATFNGRASRSEYWWMGLTQGVIYLAFALATGQHTSVGQLLQGNTPTGLKLAAGGGIVAVIYLVWSLATLIPSLAVAWRRFHDSNHSGLWYFMWLVPVIGWIVNIILLVKGPNPAGARFDRNTGD